MSREIGDLGGARVRTRVWVRAETVMLGIALVLSVAGTGALGAVALIYPAQLLDGRVVSVLALLVFCSLCGLVTSLVFIRRDPNPPSWLGPVTASIVLAITLICWALATSVPASGISVLRTCLDQRHVCIVRYGATGRDLLAATFSWALAFALVLAAFTWSNRARERRT